MRFSSALSRNSSHYFLLIAAMLVAVCFGVSPAYAQLCKGCDMTYRDVKVKCIAESEMGNLKDGETVATRPPCPTKPPMPMKDTPLKSFIKDFSPYLFAYARDKDDPAKAYTGDYYRGTVNDPSIVTTMLADEESQNPQAPTTPTSAKSATIALATCKRLIKLPGSITSVEDQAKFIRLELDSCTNQYIMRAALYPYQKEDPRLFSRENPDDDSELISLKTNCQPLKIRKDTKQEYYAGDYLWHAWLKLLEDPKHRKDSKAPMEPHYPDGLTFKETIPYPETTTDITLAAIGAVEYEEINDTSHPYTPRWDFQDNERDKYSPTTEAYSSDTTNSVFCAGVREGDEKMMMKVDILSFRRDVFNKWITNRIDFNTACYLNVGAQMNPCCRVRPNGSCTPLPCWTCYGLSQKSDSESNRAPCPTHYTGLDMSIRRPCGAIPRPGCYCLSSRCLANPITQKKYRAPCTRDNSYHTSENNIDKLCKDLRAPVTPINKLKMRYHNKEDEENDALPEGVPEGLTFKEYFTDHMPYPRLWDTGSSLQENAKPEEQDPMDNKGQWTAIVGVGREAEPEGTQQQGASSSSGAGGGQQEEKAQDQRCLYGGWGDDVSVGGVSFKKPDGITSWTELKLYQARGLRQTNISCIHRYEKTFKPGDSEGLALFKTGGQYNSFWQTKCSGEGKDKKCEFTPLPEAGNTAQQGGGDGKPHSSDTSVELKPESWPRVWRGYLSAKKDDERFPKLCDGQVLGGLDNAECGDIVMMPDGATEGGKPGLAKVGVVTQVNLPNKKSCRSSEGSNCTELKNCYVDVVEYDNGKSPDTCGTTDTWGNIRQRRLYKSGMLDAHAKTEIEGLDWITSCEDTKLSKCEMKAWDSVKLYRISESYCSMEATQ